LGTPGGEKGLGYYPRKTLEYFGGFPNLETHFKPGKGLGREPTYCSQGGWGITQLTQQEGSQKWAFSGRIKPFNGQNWGGTKSWGKKRALLWDFFLRQAFGKILGEGFKFTYNRKQEF